MLVEFLEQGLGGRFLRELFPGTEQRGQFAPGAGLLADLREPRSQVIANITIVRGAFGSLLQQAQPLF